MARHPQHRVAVVSYNVVLFRHLPSPLDQCAFGCGLCGGVVLDLGACTRAGAQACHRTTIIQYLVQPSIEGYAASVVCFATSAVIELATEPLWVLAQLQLNVKLRVCFLTIHYEMQVMRGPFVADCRGPGAHVPLSHQYCDADLVQRVRRVHFCAGLPRICPCVVCRVLRRISITPVKGRSVGPERPLTHQT